VQTSLNSQQKAGEQLFDHGQFNGNDRTCATCHGDSTGTLSPQQIEDIFDENPRAPLFRGIDADIVGGNTYHRLINDATIRMTIPLPPNVSIVGSSARSVQLFRGIPSTLNTPALQAVLMSDGRAPNLQAQAADAIASHFQPGRSPTASELDAIAAYEKTQFSSAQLASFAAGGPAPVMPLGRTASEQRGRKFFVDDAPIPAPRCVHCHSGPNLDTTSPGFQVVFGVPAGMKIFTAFVSQLRTGGGEVLTYEFRDAAGNVTTIQSPDPGRALITGNPADADMFKIPSLWNAKNTAPYFHNNGAKTLNDLVNHYEQMFLLFGFQLTTQEKADIAAYQKLL
jgi:cytochrome c peroxidase